MPKLNTHSDGSLSYFSERAIRCSSCGTGKPITRMKANSTQCLHCHYGKSMAELTADAKKRARLRGLACDIDTEFVEQLLRKQGGMCAVTGVEFNSDATSGGRVKRPWQASIDRKDVGKGYVRSNVQLVCCVVNLAKNEFDMSIFDDMCRARVQHLTCPK